MFFYEDDDDAMLTIHMTILVDTSLLWVELLIIPVSEVSGRVNMMFGNPEVMDSVQKNYHIYHEIISDIK